MLPPRKYLSGKHMKLEEIVFLFNSTPANVQMCIKFEILPQPFSQTPDHGTKLWNRSKIMAKHVKYKGKLPDKESSPLHMGEYMNLMAVKTFVRDKTKPLTDPKYLVKKRLTSDWQLPRGKR